MSFWKKKNQDSVSDSNKPESSVPDTAAQASSEQLKASVSQDIGKSENSPIKTESYAAAFNQSQDASYSKVRSALSAGTVIQGKLSFDTPVRIDGKLSGEVYSSKVLIVGETALINANIEASSLIIMGKIKGTIKASEKVQLCAGSDVDGTIISPSLVIESGARFNGSSDMGSPNSLNLNKDETKIFSNNSVDLDEMLNKNTKPKASAKIEKDILETEAPLN